MSKTKPGYCAAPWVEGVLKADGTLFTCCRSTTFMGNWQKSGLERTYNSEAFQDFRLKVINGEADDACASCIKNGTFRSLKSELYNPYFNVLSELNLSGQLDENDYLSLCAFLDILKHRELSQKVENVISECNKTINGLKEANIAVNPYLKKFETIIRIAESFYNKNTIVSVIAPYRQISLITKCNARCVQCFGRYTGTIEDGPGLDDAYFDEAFSKPEDIISFFTDGSEFLLYGRWQEVAQVLKDNLVKLNISTNGILLSRKNIKYLIDNALIKNINISIDGARKETVESIRKNVKFEKLLDSIDFLFRYVNEKKYKFSVSFSFVLMKRNYTEYPELIELISKMIKKVCQNDEYLSISFFCQNLEAYDKPNYNEFVANEHISLADRDSLIRMFDKCLAHKRKYNVKVNVTLIYSIEKFIELGYPIPEMPEKARMLREESQNIEGNGEN